jgi:predicted phosphodiesterase
MNKVERDVSSLMKEGLGRRRIAEALDISVWHVRKIVRSIAGKQGSVSKGKSTRVKPKKIIKQQNASTSKSRGQTKTKVEILSVGIESELESDILTRKPNAKIIVLSDIHLPYHDPNALRIALEYMDDCQPDTIVLNGDIADFYGVSSYAKTKKDAFSYQEELDFVRDWLEMLVARFPKSEIYYIEGNHETRAKRTLANRAPDYLSVRDLRVKVQLGLDILGIIWVPESQELKIGNLMFIHGHKARRHAGTTARAHFEDYGCSIIVGHVHRLSVAYKRNKFGNHAMIENGTLCDLDVEYMKYPDWQHGFTEVNYDGDDFSIVQHPIIDYKLITSDKVYVA